MRSNKQFYLFHFIGYIILYPTGITGSGRSLVTKPDESQQINLTTDLSSQELNENTRIRTEPYRPTWESLDRRPLPDWYDKSKIGVFIHWGVFSVPAYGGAWFWQSWKTARKLGNPKIIEFMQKNYSPRFTYQDFGPQFTAEFFDPAKWADIFSKSGAKYVVLTSKHHEGFTLWPSKYSFGWNSMDIGPKRDLVGDLADAIRTNTSLRFGLYHSLYEWFNPLYILDAKNKFSSELFVQSKTMPELYEIVNAYKPEIVWSDGDWEAPAEYWKSKEFLAWLYNESPVKETVVTNDRWGAGCTCKHGGYMTCSDRYNPGVLLPRKWENCMTLDKGFWANRRDAQIEDYLTPEELIKTVIETVACGGNILINVGPTKEGIIVPVQEERLLQLGEWLSINGEGIYETVPWKSQNDTLTANVWYTWRPVDKKLYALLTTWPNSQILNLGSVDGDEVKGIEILGTPGKLKWVGGSAGKGIIVKMPCLEKVKSRWAWSLLIHTK